MKRRFILNKLNIFLFTVLAGLFIVWPAAAKDLITTEKALKKMFKKVADFKKYEIELSGEQIARVEEKAHVTFAGTHLTIITYYRAKKDGQTVGYALEDTVMGKWGPIHYLLGVDPSGKILKTIILDYQEIRGRPIAKSRFLRQYKGKSILSPLKLRKDIDGVTGATISSRSLTNGIRKLVHIFDILEKLEEPN